MTEVEEKIRLIDQAEKIQKILRAIHHWIDVNACEQGKYHLSWKSMNAINELQNIVDEIVRGLE